MTCECNCDGCTTHCEEQEEYQKVKVSVRIKIGDMKVVKEED